MSGDLTIAARDLVLAVFRLAFADYVGVAYGHDEPGDHKYTQINPEVQAEAEEFLTGPWASHLADLAGFPMQKVWKQAQLDRLRRPARPSLQVVAAAERPIDGNSRSRRGLIRSPMEIAA